MMHRVTAGRAVHVPGEEARPCCGMFAGVQEVPAHVLPKA